MLILRDIFLSENVIFIDHFTVNDLMLIDISFVSSCCLVLKCMSFGLETKRCDGRLLALCYSCFVCQFLSS